MTRPNNAVVRMTQPQIEELIEILTIYIERSEGNVTDTLRRALRNLKAAR